MIGIGRTSEGDGHTRAARVPYMELSRPRPYPAKPRVAPSYDTPPRDLRGSTSLREPRTSQGMRRERLSYLVLRRHLGGTGTLAGSTFSDNFKVGCIACDSDGGPFPFMHACIHHGTSLVNAPPKKGHSLRANGNPTSRGKEKRLDSMTNHGVPPHSGSDK
jgi:hypothetical protein